MSQNLSSTAVVIGALRVNSLALWESDWQKKFNVANCERDPALFTQANPFL